MCVPQGLRGFESLPPSGFPGFAGRNDSGDVNPSRQFGVASENGPELIFIAEVSLIANCKQCDMKLAMSIIAELAHSSCEKVPDDEIFYAAE